uniref:Uncharacterized protein n=1 Tax=Oryza rufipogon TaxID=4529 RepID=A0A0E0N3M0_ORYRU
MDAATPPHLPTPTRHPVSPSLGIAVSHIFPPVLLPNPQSPSEDPCDLRPKSPRRRPALRSASSQRLSALSPNLSETQCRFVVVELVAPQPPRGRGAGRSRSLLVDPPANTTTNHLVHGHLLASHGCCSSAPPHLSSWRVGYTLVWDINNVPLPLLQIRCFFHSMRYTCEIFTFISHPVCFLAWVLAST